RTHVLRARAVRQSTTGHEIIHRRQPGADRLDKLDNNSGHSTILMLSPIQGRRSDAKERVAKGIVIAYGSAVLIHASRTTKTRRRTPSTIQHACSLETPRAPNRAAPLPPTPH
ncbi:unnamed protein product, partial [Ectocarpus sp. 4 AP-2014]